MAQKVFFLFRHVRGAQLVAQAAGAALAGFLFQALQTAPELFLLVIEHHQFRCGQLAQVATDIVFFPVLHQHGCGVGGVGAQDFKEPGKDFRALAVLLPPAFRQVIQGRQLRVLQQQGDGAVHRLHQGGAGAAAPPPADVSRSLLADDVPAGKLGELLLHHVPEHAAGELVDVGAGQADQAGAAVQGGHVHLLLELAEQELGQGLGPLHALAEFLLADLAHQAVRVFALGQEQEAGLATVAQQGQGGFQGFPGGVAAGAVAVEAEDHLGGAAEQLFQVIGGGGGAQGGHDVADAELGQGHHVHVAFHHQQGVDVFQGLAGLVQAVQLPALVKDGSFRGVEILGCVVAHDPSAETHHPAAGIADGEHDAVAETVVLAALAAGQQAGLFQEALPFRAAAQGLHQVVPAWGGKAHAEFTGDLAGQAALFQVAGGLGRFGVPAQLGAVPGGGFLHQLVQGAVVRPLLEGDGVGYLQAHAGGQFLHGLGKAEVVVFHEKAQGRAVGAATETVIELLGRADGEGGGLFVMEGTAGLVFAAGAAQGHALVDDVNHIHPRKQAVDELWGYSSGHRGSLTGISR